MTVAPKPGSLIAYRAGFFTLSGIVASVDRDGEMLQVHNGYGRIIPVGTDKVLGVVRAA